MISLGYLRLTERLTTVIIRARNLPRVQNEEDPGKKIPVTNLVFSVHTVSYGQKFIRNYIRDSSDIISLFFTVVYANRRYKMASDRFVYIIKRK